MSGAFCVNNTLAGKMEVLREVFSFSQSLTSCLQGYTLRGECKGVLHASFIPNPSEPFLFDPLLSVQLFALQTDTGHKTSKRTITLMRCLNEGTVSGLFLSYHDSDEH